MAAYRRVDDLRSPAGDCLYTGISSGPNARCRVWEAFTFTLLLVRISALYRCGLLLQTEQRAVSVCRSIGWSVLVERCLWSADACQSIAVLWDWCWLPRLSVASVHVTESHVDTEALPHPSGWLTSAPCTLCCKTV